MVVIESLTGVDKGEGSTFVEKIIDVINGQLLIGLYLPFPSLGNLRITVLQVHSIVGPYISRSIYRKTFLVELTLLPNSAIYSHAVSYTVSTTNRCIDGPLWPPGRAATDSRPYT